MANYILRIRKGLDPNAELVDFFWLLLVSQVPITVGGEQIRVEAPH